jgi:hypothetical protein
MMRPEPPLFPITAETRNLPLPFCCSPHHPPPFFPRHRR